MAEKQFWEEEYTDLAPGVTIRFKKMSSLDVLDLADRNIGKSGENKEFKKDCLKNVVWSNGGEWHQLMDDDGNVSLSGLKHSALLDIFFKFRSVVCLPVFTESKAYQTLSNLQKEEESTE